MKASALVSAQPDLSQGAQGANPSLLRALELQQLRGNRAKNQAPLMAGLRLVVVWTNCILTPATLGMVSPFQIPNRLRSR